MDPISTYLWKRSKSWTSKIGKNVQKKCSISNWDEIVAELFRDDGALLSGDGLCVRGDDDRLHLDWSSWWWWLWGCSGKGGGKQMKMVITFSPFSQDADHRFPSWHGPPCRCSRCTCTWAGAHQKSQQSFYRVFQKVPDRITKEKSIKPQTWNLSFKGPWKEPQM